MNYSELCAAVQSYTENTFSAVELATFAQQTEKRIYNSVQFPALRKNVTGATVAGDKYINTPGDFLAVYSLAIADPVTGAYSYPLNKDVNFLREAYPLPTDTGAPRFYALFGPTVTSGSVITNEMSVMLAPTPDAAYPLELHYFYYPESIVTAGSTWLGDNYDPVLLYGMLVEAYIFMKGETDMQSMYEAKFKEALAQAKRLGDGMERGDAYRNGQYRQPVN